MQHGKQRSQARRCRPNPVKRIIFGKKKGFVPKTRSRIGLDIGTHSVKMIEVSSGIGKDALVCLGIIKRAQTTREALGEAIRSLSKEMKVSTKDAVISVSGPSVIVRFVSMPKMREDELESAINFEAEKHVPFAISDCIVDYQVLKSNEKENKLELLLAVVKKDLVLDRVAIAEESGFSVNAVDVDTFAVANAFFKRSGHHEAEKTAALLNTGASFINVSIVHDQILSFSRDVAVSEAAAKGGIHNIVDEMRMSFSYYENQSGRGVDEIYLSGGACGMAGIEQALQEAFELKPVLWDPLQCFNTSKVIKGVELINENKGSFAVAAGLVVR